jgi:hypothetical protein
MKEIKNLRHQLTNSAHTIVDVNIAAERQRQAARLHARQALSACLLKWHGGICEDQQVHIKVAKAQATTKRSVRLLLKERRKHSALCALTQWHTQCMHECKQKEKVCIKQQLDLYTKDLAHTKEKSEQIVSELRQQMHRCKRKMQRDLSAMLLGQREMHLLFLFSTCWRSNVRVSAWHRARLISHSISKWRKWATSNSRNIAETLARILTRQRERFLQIEAVFISWKHLVALAVLERRTLAEHEARERALIATQQERENKREEREREREEEREKESREEAGMYMQI